MNIDAHAVLNKIAIAHAYAQMQIIWCKDDTHMQKLAADLIKALDEAVSLINR